MKRRFEHTLSITINVQSELKSGKDICIDDVTNALTRQWANIVENLVPVRTKLLRLSQEEFRKTSEVCPRCGHDNWIQLGQISFDTGYIYQTRKCQKCDEGWTCRFEAAGYISHSD